MKVAVAGIGYVGLSLATLLSVKHEVMALDIIEDKVKMLNDRISPIKSEYIENFFDEKDLNLTATLDYKEAFTDAKFIIVCTPTNYDDELDFFDTSSVEDIIMKVKSLNLDTTIVIKSTVPVGFTKNVKKKYDIDNIIFSPEFLREDQALYDNLYPSRIIVGEKSDKAKEFANLLKESCLKEDVVIKYMDSTEAEAVKLFANTYLALRVSFFNELDTYAEINNLNTKDIIEGVCLDPRVGNYYNNPSFGYGGYCLPKDTKQLLANYKDVPQNMIEAIVKSNDTRKDHIANMILKKNSKIIGIYRLTMKSGSDNFRVSAMRDIIEKLRERGLEIIVYEPTIKDGEFERLIIQNDLDVFKETSDIIVVNRLEDNLDDVKHKIYTRDFFLRD